MLRKTPRKIHEILLLTSKLIENQNNKNVKFLQLKNLIANLQIFLQKRSKFYSWR